MEKILKALQQKHICFKHVIFTPLAVQPHCANARWIRCQADLNSFLLGELEETTGTSPYYGPGITEPLPAQSNWRGSESSTLENDDYIWCYALTV